MPLSQAKETHKKLDFYDFDSSINHEESSKQEVKKEALPLFSVAIMGRPNVGKSSLFNRLIKQQIAITSHISGSTRDANVRQIDLYNTSIKLIDTGGLDKAKKEELAFHVSQNAIKAGLKSDLVLYVLDGQGITLDEDLKAFRMLQQKKPCILVLNKMDNDNFKLNESEFTRFGVKGFCISVVHNRGITQLLTEVEKILLSLPSKKIKKQDIAIEEEIRVGIIGRVNVGKSSLLNALTSKQRSITSNLAGTTLDPVDECISFENKTIRFIDTAGIRQKGKIANEKTGIERYALDRTKKVLKQCHVALLVLDSSSDFVELDEKISSEISKNDLAIIVVLNKWDIRKNDYKETINLYKHKFKFLHYAPFITVSSITLQRIHEIKGLILKVYQSFTKRISTSALNDAILKAQKKHALPSDHGKIIRIYYATQFEISPPKIALVMNKPNALHFSYKRFLANFLREEFDFLGVPILIFARSKNNEWNKDHELSKDSQDINKSNEDNKNHEEIKTKASIKPEASQKKISQAKKQESTNKTSFYKNNTSLNKNKEKKDDFFRS